MPEPIFNDVRFLTAQCPYEHYTAGADDQVSSYGNIWMAMTFTPQVDHPIRVILLKAYRIGSPGILTVSIRATNSKTGKPTGPDLASGSIDANSFIPGSAELPGSPGLWYAIRLEKGCPVVAGTKYAIVLAAPSGSAGNQAVFKDSKEIRGYARGQVYTSNNDGESWSGFPDPGYYDADLLFEEWETWPPELWSGQPFNLEFYAMASDDSIRAHDYPANYAVIRDVDGNEDHVTASIKQGNRVVWGPSSRPIAHYSGGGGFPPGWQMLIKSPDAAFKEIEYLMDAALEDSQQVGVDFSLVLEFTVAPSSSPQAVQTEFSEEFPFTWPIVVDIPGINVVVANYPSVVQKGNPFTIYNCVGFPFLPLDVSYCHLYIKLSCVGEDGMLREPVIWEAEFGTEWTSYYPNYNWLGSKDSPQPLTLNIEDITGSLAIPWRHYDITVKVGYSAAGTIVDTDTPWQRHEEVTFIWPVDVVVGEPGPDFLGRPDSLYPPYSVKLSDSFTVIMAIENFGSPGTCYIDGPQGELWRGDLGYMDSDQWSSGPISIEDLLGTITESGQYQVVFTCGYIDSSGKKVPTGSIARTIYVVAVGGKVNLTIAAGEGGTTDPAPGTYQYDYKSGVKVTAIPDEGYHFDHWEGVSGITPTANPVAFTIKSDQSLKAIFAVGAAPTKASWVAPAAAIGGIFAFVVALGVALSRRRRKRK